MIDDTPAAIKRSPKRCHVSSYLYGSIATLRATLLRGGAVPLPLALLRSRRLRRPQIRDSQPKSSTRDLRCGRTSPNHPPSANDSQDQNPLPPQTHGRGSVVRDPGRRDEFAAWPIPAWAWLLDRVRKFCMSPLTNTFLR